MSVKFTGERMIPEFNKEDIIYLEHITRYFFAEQFVKNKVVLDAACGSGYGTYCLSKSGAKKVIGVDISKETINYAKSKYAAKRIEFIVGNVENLPFKDGNFDVIVSMETIEHLQYPDKFLKEAKRLLKKNGFILLSTPNSLVYPKGNIFHIHEFTEKELNKKILNYFKNSKLFYQHNCISSYILNDDKSIFFSKELLYQKLFSFKPENNMYILFLATNSKFPDIKEANVMSSPENLAELYMEVENLLKKISQTETALHKNIEEIQKIYNSRGWKIISSIHNLKIKIPILNRL